MYSNNEVAPPSQQLTKRAQNQGYKTMYSNNEVPPPSTLTATREVSTESRIRQRTAIMKLQNKCASGSKHTQMRSVH